MNYTHDTIQVGNGTTVALRFVESIRFDVDTDENATIDKLKDDMTIHIRTLSGYEYDFSAKQCYGKLYGSDHGKPVYDIASAIYQRWIWIMEGGRK